MATPEEDATLIQRFQEGEESALEQLISTHKEGLFRFIYRHLNHAEESADVLSETFIKAYQKRHQYQPRAQFQTWLYTIARNLCHDHLRKRKSRPGDYDAGLAEDELALAQQLRTEIDPANEAVTADEVARIHSAIAKLPDSLRSALILYALEGHSQQETAQILGCSEKAVENRVRRAREALKGVL